MKLFIFHLFSGPQPFLKGDYAEFVLQRDIKLTSDHCLVWDKTVRFSVLHLLVVPICSFHSSSSLESVPVSCFPSFQKNRTKLNKGITIRMLPGSI